MAAACLSKREPLLRDLRQRVDRMVVGEKPFGPQETALQTAWADQMGEIHLPFLLVLVSLFDKHAAAMKDALDALMSKA